MLADADDNADRAPATLPAVLIPATEDDAPADELSSVMSAMMDDDDDDGSCVGCCYFLVGGACFVCVCFREFSCRAVGAVPARPRSRIFWVWLVGCLGWRRAVFEFQDRGCLLVVVAATVIFLLIF